MTSNAASSRESLLIPTGRPFTQTCSTLSAAPTWSTIRRPFQRFGHLEGRAVEPGRDCRPAPRAAPRGTASARSCRSAGRSPASSRAPGRRPRPSRGRGSPASANRFGARSGAPTSRNRHRPSSDRTHGLSAVASRAVATSGAGSSGLRIGSRPTCVISGRVQASRRSSGSVMSVSPGGA